MPATDGGAAALCRVAAYSLGFRAANDDLGEVGPPRFELRFRERELRAKRLIVELGEQLAFLDDHASQSCRVSSWMRQSSSPNVRRPTGLKPKRR